jgi:hypothetical protein
MKTNPIHRCLLALATIALLVASPSLAAADDSPVSSISSDLKSTPFEKRDEFTAAVKDAAAQLDQRITDLQAEQVGRTPSDSLTRAREELKAARADLEDRINALGYATAETWNTVRDHTLASLLRLNEAYRKAKSA